MTAAQMRPVSSMPDYATLQPGDALIVVDVQNDFLPGGRLGVPRGDEVVPVLNRYARLFAEKGLPVYATRDWHPPDHCSFEARGGPWPVHCVADSPGAAFAPALDLPQDSTIVHKAAAPDRDAYSGFEGTALHERLQEDGVGRVFVGGLATDYCVLNTVRDALARGYETYLLADAVRAVNVDPQDGARAEAEMRRLGARAVTLDSVRA